MFISPCLKFKVRSFQKQAAENSITLNASPFESFILKITFKMLFSNGFFFCNPICRTCSFSHWFQALCTMCSYWFCCQNSCLTCNVCLLWLYLSLFEIVPSSLEKLSSEMSVPSKLQDSSFSWEKRPSPPLSPGDNLEYDS